MAIQNEKGSVSIDAQNIMPVIKRWLYSDKDIFIREMVSNGCDAITKYRMLKPGADESMAVSVTVNKDEKTIAISDTGIGMTADEVRRYINQVAFSSAAEFMKQVAKDEAEDKDGRGGIIGHFGLGFYSVFMVSEKVEIDTLSYQDGAEPVHWQSEDGMSFEMSAGSRTEHGTTVTLHISAEEEEFLEASRLRGILSHYCGYMAYPITLFDACAKPVEREEPVECETDADGKPVMRKVTEEPKPEQINDTAPLWLKKPSDCTEEEYKTFYHKVFTDYNDPLFWIHLNVDYPFNLTGILYFPKIKSNIELQKNKIQLYCNQVFVTDQVEGIVPEFLTLLHGVIDSPDIPLNVSRSYLQSDREVKKISTYITKKVADRLNSIFKENRKEYEEKWDDLKLFINYGILSEDGFYDRAKDFTLMKDTDGKYFTFDEYKTLIEANQKDKNDQLVYLYATDKEEQYSYIKAAQDKGYSVLLLDGQLDVPTIQTLEQKFEKSHFTRVDADIIDRLIVKDDAPKNTLSEEQSDNLSAVFRTQMPKIDKAEFIVQVDALGAEARPVIITQNEYMRRMKEMSKFQAGMGFYGQMPDSYNIVLNSDHPLVKKVLDDSEAATAEALKPIVAELKGQEARLAAIRQAQDKKKYDELTQEDKDQKAEAEKAVQAEKDKKQAVIADYAKTNDIVHQLIDLALLQNGMLKGEALDKFLKRSVDLIK